MRQLIFFLLNLCLILFLADAVLSLADETFQGFFSITFLAGIRGLLATFMMLFGLGLYFMIGLTPVIPKRFFLPITLFNPALMLLAVPAWIYFTNSAHLVTWSISLLQVLVGAVILRQMRGSLNLRWPLVPQSCVEGKLFSWPNLASFCAVNLVIVLPCIVGYLLFCTARAVDHFTDGFVALRRVGFTMRVRKYVRDDGKSILLVPMSHIGEPEFYHSLSQSFPTNSTILMEGVTDDKNLLTNHITYKRMANSLGLAQQQREFKPSPVQMVMADIDVDQFSPRTIDFLNVVMLIHTRGLTAQNFLLLMQSSQSPEFEQQIFSDLLGKRNAHLLQQINEYLPQSEGLVVPWGAAHMPGISREIQKSGFHLASSQEFVAIRFGHRNRGH